MNIISSEDQAFLKRLNAIVEANLHNEQFGVNELAQKAGLSRSQIHRRLKSISNKSVSQFIREVRLEKAKELLEEETLTVSEIAYKVGFGSPSYFIKSFHDLYGYPPGDEKKHLTNMAEQEEHNQPQSPANKLFTSRRKLIYGLAVIVIFLFTYFVWDILPVGSPAKRSNNTLEKSVIVLPLENLTTDKENQYLADGISEDIRSQLAKIPGLKVISGMSAEKYRETILSAPEIARQVNADYILAGSIRQWDSILYINIALSDAMQDRVLWPEKYERKMEDIFETQLDIAQNVADQLHLILSPEEIEQIEKLQPKNPEAYNNYLLGQYFCLKRDSASIQKGIGYFKKAIEIDPGYALAYAGLADGFYALSITGNIERSSGYATAYKMAEQALEMDSTLAEAYAVLGVVSKFGYWEWEKSRSFLKKALALDSTCMVAHLYYCSFLDIVGEPEKALYHANKAIELEPYFHMPYHMKGLICHNINKFDESTTAIVRSHELNPEYWDKHLILSNYLYLNDEISAVKFLSELFSVEPEFQKYENRIYPAYETSGINSVLTLYLDAIYQQNEIDPLFLIPLLNNRLGMSDKALTLLERACRESRADIPRMIRYPEFENLHSNPRFQALVDTMNLRPYFPKPIKPTSSN